MYETVIIIWQKYHFVQVDVENALHIYLSSNCSLKRVLTKLRGGVNRYSKQVFIVLK